MGVRADAQLDMNGEIGQRRRAFGPLLKPGEVALGLGVSRSWLYQAAKDGRIPSIRLGGADGPLRFVEADLVDWVERARAAWRPGDSARDTLERTAA